MFLVPESGIVCLLDLKRSLQQGSLQTRDLDVSQDTWSGVCAVVLPPRCCYFLGTCSQAGGSLAASGRSVSCAAWRESESPPSCFLVSISQRSGKKHAKCKSAFCWRRVRRVAPRRPCGDSVPGSGRGGIPTALPGRHGGAPWFSAARGGPGFSPQTHAYSIMRSAFLSSQILPVFPFL